VRVRAQVGRRVLVVDDNQDAATTMAHLIEGYGHEVRTAGDGPAALALLQGFRPEVALLDIGLPVMDGYELARRLMEVLGGDHLGLVAVTGYGKDPARQRSRDAGFHVHLTKPVSLELLLAALTDCENQR